MKRQIAVLLCICFLFVSCGTASVPDSTGNIAALPQASATPDEVSGPPALEPPALSFMEALAAEVLQKEILVNGETGEAAIRAVYHWLLQTVRFGDPVGLDVWRYLSDDTEPIPYLENRAFSPLRFRIGSCEDFAAAMTLLLRAAGFDAEYVAGFTLSVDQAYIDHAWAVVRLGGVWYHIDPQLEQNVTRNHSLTYRYYLKSDKEFALDHKWGENLIDYWPDMPDEEKQAIRALYTPPVCTDEYPPPEAITIPLPLKQNMAEIETEISTIKKQSGKAALSPIPLNVEPPVLVAAHHVTPPLLDSVDAACAYGRSFLAGEEAAFYDALRAALIAPLDGMRVSIPESVTDARALYVSGALASDEPLFYWASFDLIQENGTRDIRISLSVPLDVIESRQHALEAKANQILTPVADASPFEKALAIHDAMAAVNYDRAQAGENSGNAYGALLEGKATCNGYARGFQYLANLAGLEAAYLRGRSLRGAEHAWNAVKLDDVWHFADATWDRPLREYDGIYHDYFLISTEEMYRDRFWDDTQYPALPDTDAAGFSDYYSRMDYAVTIAAPDDTGEQARILADIFYRQLKAKAAFLSQAEPVFLELKIQGGRQNYLDWKEAYVKQVFHILDHITAMSDADNLPVDIIRDTSVKCDFNDTMQILTFYPNVRARETQKR